MTIRPPRFLDRPGTRLRFIPRLFAAGPGKLGSAIEVLPRRGDSADVRRADADIPKKPIWTCFAEFVEDITSSSLGETKTGPDGPRSPRNRSDRRFRAAGASPDFDAPGPHSPPFLPRRFPHPLPEESR